MYSPGNPHFSLSEEGQRELGHIFTEGVPIYPGTFIMEVKLEGNPENDRDLVVLVDWAKLSYVQQEQCLYYMSDKRGVGVEVIHADIKSLGYFALRSQFIIEAYDLRFFL